MNEQRADKINKRYAVEPVAIKGYMATPMMFSRPLGINYGSVGLSTPISSYLAQAKVYANTFAPIQNSVPVVEQQVNSQVDNQRNSLFSEIYRMRSTPQYNKTQSLTLYN